MTTRGREGDEIGVKRARSPTREGKGRYSGGGVDGPFDDGGPEPPKRPKTDDSAQRRDRDAYPPTGPSSYAPTNGSHYPGATYPPRPGPVGAPTGPRALSGRPGAEHPLYSSAMPPSSSATGAPLDAPLSYPQPHPNALPVAPGSSGVKLHLATSQSTSHRNAPTGSSSGAGGGRPGFVPIGAARDTPAAPLKTAAGVGGGDAGASAGSPAATARGSSASGGGGGDIKRFFPRDDEESSAAVPAKPSKPSAALSGSASAPAPAPASKLEEGMKGWEVRGSYSRRTGEQRRAPPPLEERDDRMEVDERDRDRGRDRDRERERDRDWDRDRRDRDRDRDRDRGRGDDDYPRVVRSSGDRGWMARGREEVPPPRYGRSSRDEDDLSRSASGRFQPAVSTNGFERSANEKRASYERPTQAAPGEIAGSSAAVGTSANSVAPVAQRRWGAPDAARVEGESSESRRGSPGPAAGRGLDDSAPTPRMGVDSEKPSAVAMPAEIRDAPSNVPTPAPAAPAPPPAPVELYERLVQVGEGTYGKVYKAKNVETGGLVALKRIRMEAERDGFPVTAVREIKLLQSLRHPNVVELVEMLVAKGECDSGLAGPAMVADTRAVAQAKSTWSSSTSITT